MNVLLSSAGRRNYLVRYFKDALKGRGHVLAADTCKEAPALVEADLSFVVPPFSSESYIDSLIGICRNYNVGLVFPLNDFELSILARSAGRVLQEAGSTVVVSTPTVVDLCLDKLATLRFLEQQAILTPKTYSDLPAASAALARGELRFPVIVKPRWGSGSIGQFCAHSQSELEVAVIWCERAIRSTVLATAAEQEPAAAVLIQERLIGTEYGFDVVNDLNGRYVCTLSRIKLNSSGGEADRAVTVAEPDLSKLGQQIGSKLGHLGMLDCDAIQTHDGLVVLDMNPRFGGGYPFSHVAGANIPAAFLAWSRHEELSASWLQYAPGVLSTKTLEIRAAFSPRV
jgi:carbamoyl-phosphate synthase large subunit